MSSEQQQQRLLLDWAAQMSLCEVDANMRAHLCAPASRADLLAIQPDLQAWLDLPDQEAIEQGQEAYAAAFLLPGGPGLRLAGFTQGDNERLGPALADELAQLLGALNLGPDQERFGKLPSDHVALALGALGALLASDPPLRVQGLQEANFSQALQAWARRVSEQPGVHPLYQALGKICCELVDQTLERFSNPGSGAQLQLKVLQ